MTEGVTLGRTPYLDREWLVEQARLRPPAETRNTVSSFSDWVFSLYHPGCSLSRAEGQGVEFAIERSRRLEKHPPVDKDKYVLVFADPLDRSASPYKISSLSLKGSPLFGIPDVVFREKRSGRIVIFERKVTRAVPNEWPNLKVQLWCYGKIDDWRGAPDVTLAGSIYEPDRYDFSHSTCVGPWSASDTAFESECRELFELFGGKVAC
jgi:hypothetical protein